MADDKKKNSTSRNEEASHDEDGRHEGRLTDTLKKLFAAGVSSAFMSEEGLRSYLADMKLPKEILQMILQGAVKSKDDIVNRVSREMIGILQKIDFVKEFSRFAEDHKFIIKAEVEIQKKQKKDAPS